MTCGKRSSIGSECVLEAGHEGRHRSKWDTTWSDDSDRRFGAQIAKSMEGRRD